MPSTPIVESLKTKEVNGKSQPNLISSDLNSKHYDSQDSTDEDLVYDLKKKIKECNKAKEVFLDIEGFSKKLQKINHKLLTQQEVFQLLKAEV